MSFGEHLDELRSRLVRALIVPLPLAVVLFMFAEHLRALLVAPLFAALRANGQTVQIQALSPAETITTDMKLAVIGALAISAPWLLYQLWKFVEPGLYARERRFVHFLTPLSAVLTACGIALFYWILLPLTLLFLVGFGSSKPRTIVFDPASDAVPATSAGGAPDAAQPVLTFPVVHDDPPSPRPGQAWISTRDQVLRVAVPLERAQVSAVIGLAEDAAAAIAAIGEEPEDPAAAAAKPVELSVLELPLAVLGGISQVYRLSEYVGFTLILLAGSVIAFQMPIVILLLGWVGLVEPKMLREKRRWAIFLMGIVSAVVTPPDITSMLLLLVPLTLLYEVGILLLALVPASRVADGAWFPGRKGGFSGGARPAQTAQTDQPSSTESAEPSEGLESPERSDDDDGVGGRSE
ncbi:MAG: Sec-independent protein translocase protein TatC [Planctomycetota bacterium]